MGLPHLSTTSSSILASRSLGPGGHRDPTISASTIGFPSTSRGYRFVIGTSEPLRRTWETEAMLSAGEERDAEERRSSGAQASEPPERETREQ